MVDKDIILAKVANIQRCLKRLNEITGGEPESLLDINKQDIFVLNLERAIEATIDIAAHIVASEGLGLASTIRENFEILYESGIIDRQLVDKMQKMVGFRNIAVYEYTSLNIEILKSILKNNLGDIEEFYTLILKKFNFV
jgi:uncharacterized protein YutE (UPF0331/DUF86 family)